MSPTLRSVVTQAWRSIGSTRRNFSSSPGSKGQYGIVAFFERNLSPDAISLPAHVFGYGLYCAVEGLLIYKVCMEDDDEMSKIDFEEILKEKNRKKSV